MALPVCIFRISHVKHVHYISEFYCWGPEAKEFVRGLDVIAVIKIRVLPGSRRGFPICICRISHVKQIHYVLKFYVCGPEAMGGRWHQFHFRRNYSIFVCNAWPQTRSAKVGFIRFFLRMSRVEHIHYFYKFYRLDSEVMRVRCGKCSG